MIYYVTGQYNYCTCSFTLTLQWQISSKISFIFKEVTKTHLNATCFIDIHFLGKCCRSTIYPVKMFVRSICCKVTSNSKLSRPSFTNPRLGRFSTININSILCNGAWGHKQEPIHCLYLPSTVLPFSNSGAFLSVNFPSFHFRLNHNQNKILFPP